MTECDPEVTMSLNKRIMASGVNHVGKGFGMCIPRCFDMRDSISSIPHHLLLWAKIYNKKKCYVVRTKK